MNDTRMRLYLSGCKAYSRLDRFLRAEEDSLPELGVLLTYCDLGTPSGCKILEGYLQEDDGEDQSAEVA